MMKNTECTFKCLYHVFLSVLLNDPIVPMYRCQEAQAALGRHNSPVRKRKYTKVVEENWQSLLLQHFKDKNTQW